MDKEPKEPTDKEDSQKVAHKAQEKNEAPEKAPAEDSDEGVTVSEEFQKHAHEMTHKGTKHEMKHLHDRAYAREDELRKEEDAKKKPKDTEEFSSSDMPSASY